MTKPDEIIVVKSGQRDSYENLVFIDTDGNKHRIGKKRSRLFDFVQPGNTLKLIYATLKDKETGKDVDYINNLEVMRVSEEQKSINPIPAPVVSKEATPLLKPSVDHRDKSMCLSYAKDIIVAKINKGETANPKMVTDLADIFLKWMES